MKDVSYKNNRIFVHFCKTRLPMHSGQHYANRHCGGSVFNREGFCGNAYAIPMDIHEIWIDYNDIQRNIERFFIEAFRYPELEFYIYGLEDPRFQINMDKIVPLFKFKPNRCFVPKEWYELYEL